MKKLKKDKTPNFDQIIKYDALGRKLQSEAIIKIVYRVWQSIRRLF
jgi:hypothetical protein